jgi:ribosomal protein L21E
VGRAGASGPESDRTNSPRPLSARTMMKEFSEGERVRIDIPDETDPDHDEYHGRHGTVVAVFDDHADELTGDERDSTVYRVELDSGEESDFRWRDIRPPIEQ